MRDYKKNMERTDQAWNKLYNRLEEDNLLNKPDKYEAGRSIFFRHPLIAAAILFIMIASISIWVYSNRDKDYKDLISMENMESSSTLVTTLNDGSIVYLANKSRLYLPTEFEKNKREVKLYGNARFDVTGNAKRPFIIETKNFLIEVIGTEFNVESSPDKWSEVIVERGEVKVTLRKNGSSVRVKAGETVTLKSNRLLISQNKSASENYPTNLRFKDETLGNIIRVINKQKINPELATTPELENRILTVTFSNDNPEKVANLICMALSLRSKKENNKITLFE